MGKALVASGLHPHLIQTSNSYCEPRFPRLLSQGCRSRSLLLWFWGRGRGYGLARGGASELARIGDACLDAVIIDGDDIQQFKPDPHGLLLAIEQVRSQPGRTLYVGDNATDTETAHRAGVPFVAVLSGVTSRGELVAAPIVLSRTTFATGSQGPPGVVGGRYGH